MSNICKHGVYPDYTCAKCYNQQNNKYAPGGAVPILIPSGANSAGQDRPEGPTMVSAGLAGGYVSSKLPTRNRALTLPTDSTERKNFPLLSGCIKYFPAALAGVANISKLGNDKHNPGEALHHARGKSMDHGDCIIRHITDTEDLIAAKNRGDTSVTAEAILLEANQLAWRALAYSQMLHEQFGAPLAPGAKKEGK